MNIIDQLFGTMDHAILGSIHSMLVATGGFFSPLMRFATYIGGNILFYILLGIILLFFKRTRKIGICVLLATSLGYLISIVILKNLVNRPRPFTHEIYKAWWQYAGSVYIGQTSFPSGHATVSMAMAGAVFFNCSHRRSWPIFIFPLIVGWSRAHFLVHYPSDIVAGFLVGLLASWLVYKLISHFMDHDNRELDMELRRNGMHF